MEVHEQVHRILRHKGPQVYTIQPDATVYDALESMVEKHIGALVVMDGASLVGLVSERDYARKVILKGRSSRETKVEEIMSPPITVKCSTTVEECMRVITDKRCRHLVVVDVDRVAGLVSIGDVVNWIITSQDTTIHQLEDYICGKYPG